MYEIISANPKEGLTIGLEGEWGSGKSTVVKLLQEKLKENKSNRTFVFYIDAWEHEGDHLRRVFLETLIEKIKRWKEWGCDVVKRLNDISDRVTSKKVSKKVEHASQITGFGKAVAFAALLVPLGVSLLTVFAERVTTKWTGVVCWEFVKTYKVDKKKALNQLCVVLGFVVLILVCWFLGSSDEVKIIGYEGQDNVGPMAKLSDACLYLTYILICATIVALVWGVIHTKRMK